MADLFGSEIKKKVVSSDEVGAECDAIESELVSVRVLYEQYFLGVERNPPTQAHRMLKQRMNRLQNSFVRQTAVKFRVGSLHAKLITYERLWTRTLQEIENGTYHRDVFKARLHAKKKAEAQKAAQTAAPAGEGDKATAAKVSPAAAARPPSASGAGPGAPISDAKIKAIYDAYVSAKKRCNEDVSKISLDSLSASLRRQVPALMKQHNAKSVDFKVVIKDGKAMLRALPKE